jgi:hypothetical protein
MSDIDLPRSFDRLGNRVHDHSWIRSKGLAMKSAGSRHERERLKYKQDSTACSQLSISSRKLKYSVSTESALLFGNIMDPNKSTKMLVYTYKKNKN